jgi:IS30 family transposase
MERSTNIIWRNKLESYVINLRFEQRKNCEEIAGLIRKEKKINISREAVRKFINKESLHAITTKKP